MTVMAFIAVIIIGYLLGSIPVGVLVGKKLVGKDPRQIGSGKMGATNVLRLAGKKAATLVAILDIAKGAIPVIVAGMVVGSDYLNVGGFGVGRLTAQVLAALAGVAGHNWPIFLKFRGGRGVATFFGGLIALCPAAAIIGGEALFISAGLTRYVSLGSILGVLGTCAILVPLTFINNFPIEYLIYSLVGSAIIIIMHKDNISRLMAGNERKLGEKVPAIDSTR
jgi:glycerol-3-phosphate acyltransferase PlsY